MYTHVNSTHGRYVVSTCIFEVLTYSHTLKLIITHAAKNQLLFCAIQLMYSYTALEVNAYEIVFGSKFLEYLNHRGSNNYSPQNE